MTASTPISFLVPSYNSGPYLELAIESIADHLVPGDEVLLQDACSKDGSVDQLLARFGDQPWLKVVVERDEGQSDALERALQRATNEYVMWLNADDLVYPNGLAAVREALASGPDLVCGRSTIFQNSGRIVRTYRPRPITRRAMVGRGADIFTGSLAYRAQMLKDIGGFNAKYQYCMDMDIIARITETDPTIVYIPDVVAGLRWHEESKGGSTIWPIVREATEVRLAHARTPSEKAAAVAISGAYLVAGLMQPLRHSQAYTRVREYVRNGRSASAA